MAAIAATLVVVLISVLAALIAANRRQSQHVPFPWLWTLPSVAVIGLSLMIGAARYPALPNRIPIHFDFHGAADRYADTTAFTALFPVLLQVLVTALLIAVAALLLHQEMRPHDRPARHAALLTARGLLVLAAGLDLAFLLIAQPVWRGATDISAATLTGAGLSIVVGVAAVLVTALRAAGLGPSGPARGEDHWRGAFYVNRDDPALFVPKRHGLGWTLNFGRPSGWVVLGVLVGVPLLTALVGTVA